ncbi:MAG: xylulokinase [Alphaproteobacteria bacterium]
MALYLGIDLGTSGVKALALAEGGAIVAEAQAPLTVSHPQALWSEQAPDDWWAAADKAVRGVLSQIDRAAVQAIGLSGQMHGATVLGVDDKPLRPAILWNDGRAFAECAALEQAVPNSRAITGNIAMPGFTAPKIAWLREHEPKVADKIAKVLLPKDYLRLVMTGDHASDMSDSAGTLWLDVAARAWSDEMLAATGLTRDHMPKLYEGPQVTGRLRAEIAAGWGVAQMPVVAGGGDNAAGAVGIGVTQPGQGFLSLGTSGVYFVAGDKFRPNPAGAVHAFCHALPDTWHQMAVMLSAASCLDWAARLTGAKDVATLMASAEAAEAPAAPLHFLPYLTGERTPHNDPKARGVLFGLGPDVTQGQIGQAVLQGVAFGLADGQRVLQAAGTSIESVTAIGGGAQSQYWLQILANVLDQPLLLREGSEVGPALGAARLAQMGVTGADASMLTAPPIRAEIVPNPNQQPRLNDLYESWQALYPALKDHF